MKKPKAKKIKIKKIKWNYASFKALIKRLYGCKSMKRTSKTDMIVPGFTPTDHQFRLDMKYQGFKVGYIGSSTYAAFNTPTREIHVVRTFHSPDYKCRFFFANVPHKRDKLFPH